MTPSGESGENAAQIAYWNGPGGQRWLERQRMQDAVLAPVSSALLERAAARPGEFVIDVGCGCGATSIELARQVSPSGHVLGIDVSAPMLERAHQRKPAGLSVEFALADAATYDFAAGRAHLLFSRFGVMFFANPVRAFSRLRLGLRRGARVVFACWRTPRENPWLMLPLQEAYRHVPRLPEVKAEDPGPFSFASEPRVRHILQSSGYDAIGFDAVDLTLDLADGQGLAAAVDAALDIGPASSALEGQPPALRAAARESIRAALARYQVGETVPLPSGVWIVTAQNT